MSVMSFFLCIFHLYLKLNRKSASLLCSIRSDSLKSLYGIQRIITLLTVFFRYFNYQMVPAVEKNSGNNNNINNSFSKLTTCKKLRKRDAITLYKRHPAICQALLCIQRPVNPSLQKKNKETKRFQFSTPKKTAFLSFRDLWPNLLEYYNVFLFFFC